MKILKIFLTLAVAVLALTTTSCTMPRTEPHECNKDGWRCYTTFIPSPVIVGGKLVSMTMIPVQHHERPQTKETIDIHQANEKK